MSARTKPVKHHNQVQQGERSVTTHQHVEVFSGPVPDPETLRRYEEIVPGSAKDIVNAFTKGMAVHRFRGRMDPVIDFVSMLLSSAMVIGAAWIGYKLLLADKDIEGWSMLMGTLVVVLTAFWGKRKIR